MVLVSVGRTHILVWSQHKCLRSIILIVIFCRLVIIISTKMQQWWNIVAKYFELLWSNFHVDMCHCSMPEYYSGVIEEYANMDKSMDLNMIIHADPPNEKEIPSAAVTLQKWYRGCSVRKKMLEDFEDSLVHFSREVDHIELLLRRGLRVYPHDMDPDRCGPAPYLLQLEGCFDMPSLALYIHDRGPNHRMQIGRYDTCMHTYLHTYMHACRHILRSKMHLLVNGVTSVVCRSVILSSRCVPSGPGSALPHHHTLSPLPR